LRQWTLFPTDGLRQRYHEPAVFGMIGGGYGDETWLANEMDAAGDARVGVGFITWSMAKRPRLLDMVLERRPPAVMLSFGDIRPHAQKIKTKVRY
jgi:nitronate monooxygenase